MDIFSQIAAKIIKEQTLIIGPLALVEAKKVQGLTTDDATGEIVLSGDKGEILNQLVAQYEHLFGRASREVCREAALSLIADLPQSQVPASLR
jgi:hypothetical protein